MTRAANIPAAMCVCMLLLSAQQASAGDVPNFSGTYSSVQKPKKGSIPERITVLQTSDAIEITHMETDGKSYTNKFALNGVPGDFVTITGVHGKGRAQWKEKYLLVENVITTSPQGGSPLTFHTMERWQLSPDGSQLTIKTDMECPGQQQICSIAFPGFPITEKYRKDQQP